MDRKKIASIKKPILLPLAVALLALLAASLYGMHYVQQQNSTQQAYESLTQAQQLLQTLLQSEAQQVVFFAEPVDRDQTMREEFLGRDREGLFEAALPVFRDVLARQGISHFYFLEPDGRIFLRLHNPERFADQAKHAVAVKSQKMLKQTVGVEVGESGRLTLNVVYPWVHNGRLLGFLEFGRDLSQLVPRLKQLLGAELLFSVNKEFIDRGEWEEETKKSGRKMNWDDLPRCVVVDHTLDLIPGEICSFLRQTADPATVRTMESRYGGRKYQGGVTPLVDAGGKFIGAMTVLKDVSNREVSILAMAVYTGFSGIAIMFCVYLFFSWYVKRVDSELFAAQSSLQEALTDREKRLTLSASHLMETISRQEDFEKEFFRVSLRNQLILDSVGDGIFGLDTEGKHTFVNPLAAKLLGFAPDELLGRQGHNLWHSGCSSGDAAGGGDDCPIIQAFKTGKVHRADEDFFSRRDGSPLPVSYVSSPIWEGGKLVGAVVCFRDISKSKEINASLEESERLHRAITTTVLDAIIMLDEEDQIIYWNRAAEKIFQFTVPEVIGTSFSDGFFCPVDRETFRRASRSLWGSEGRGNLNGKTLALNVMRKGGKSFPVEMSLSAVEMAGQRCTVAVLRDISERLRAQKEWEEMQLQLRQSQKMEAIGTLAGGIAHDFNNILGAIMGYTELALINITADNPLRENLEQVRLASRRAKDLVGHILTFSRQSELARKPVEISPIVKESLKMLRASLPATIEIRQDIGKDLGRIMADPTQIHQALMNLCTNAAYAMNEKGGVLEVGLRREVLRDETILKAYNISAGEYLRLSVRDTGAGMDEDVLSRIFDPFFTTKKRGEGGTGLGLSVVHGIVSSHGGGIRVQANPGEGALFELFFPLIESEPVEPAGVVSETPLTGTERVLLVDDEEILVDLGQKALSYLGYEVVTRTSSMEALELFQATPEKFDLVITDYTMPEMTGMALAQKILEIRPEMPIILCTGFSDKISEPKARAMGIRGYIMKPVSIHNLANICRRVLEENPGAP